MKTHFLSDEELIRQYLEGKDTAFERLLQRYRDRVFAYIMYTIRDETLANDIFQETFMKVIRTLKRGKYNHQGKFLPWVNRIAHNLMIDHFRRNKKYPTTSGKDDFDIFDIIADLSPTVEDKAVKEQTRQEIKKVIQKLPQDQKEVLMMRIYFDMSFKEIAEHTEVSINTALGRMRYAIINMRKLMEKEKYLYVN